MPPTISPPAMRRQGDVRAYRPNRTSRGRGRAAQDGIDFGKGLGPERERELAERIRAGDRSARDELVAGNLALVLDVVKKVAPRGFPGLDKQDLAQEGAIGLMVAAERFDPAEHGTRFSTYAWWWIRAKILRSLKDHSRLIRIPVPVWDAGLADQWMMSVHDIDEYEVYAPEPDRRAEAEADARAELLHSVLDRCTPAGAGVLIEYAWELALPSGSAKAPARRRRMEIARALVKRLRERLIAEGPSDV